MKNISQNKSAKLRKIFTTPKAKAGLVMEEFVHCSSHLPHISVFLDGAVGGGLFPWPQGGRRGEWAVRPVQQHSQGQRSQEQASLLRGNVSLRAQLWQLSAPGRTVCFHRCSDCTEDTVAGKPRAWRAGSVLPGDSQGSDMEWEACALFPVSGHSSETLQHCLPI